MVIMSPGGARGAKRKPRWSPAEPGEPRRSEMTTGDAWWSEIG
jgi:hypothetical protein